MSMTADRTPPASRFSPPFKPGVSGNPAGRKVGSRNLLADRFFKDFYGLWEEQGEAALRRAFFENPVAVVQIVAKLMPAKLEISTPTAGLTDERFAELIEEAERMIALRASMTIEGSAVEVKGGGGSPQAGVKGGEVVDPVLYSPASTTPPFEPGPVERDGVSAEAQHQRAAPDFAAGHTGDPPLSTQAQSPQPVAEEDDIDPASLF